MKTTESGSWAGETEAGLHQGAESFQTEPGTRSGPAQTSPGSERPERQHSGKTRHTHLENG